MAAEAGHWDTMYEHPMDTIPWEIESPPAELVEVVENKLVAPPARTLDVGSGTGNYSIWLAKQGFRVTGVEFSGKAVAIAKERATRHAVSVHFIHADARELTKVLAGETFDFIFDYSLLHHIAPPDFEAYAAQFPELLIPEGKLLLVCYSEKDEDAASKQSATGKYGNTMYYRTADEIRKVYRGLKEFSYKEAHLGKRLHHAGHCFLFEKPK
jgi:2-polyprenyl-3-methyl-5-hydroxy-6-metoxy-1,4-benzoquinol methylase